MSDRSPRPARRPARRPEGRGRPALERRRRPRRRRLADARPRRPAGTSRPRSRTCSGPTRSRSSRPPTRRRGTRSCSRRSRTRPGTSTSRRSRSPGSRRRRCSPAGARPATALAAALRGFPTGQKMPWFGPPMSPASMATARFMETWAHALDVYEALGVEPEPTRPDPARRPPRRPHPQLRVLGARARAAGRGVPDRAEAPVRRDLDAGDPRTPRRR